MYMVTFSRAYLSSLLVEGVKSTPCTPFLQMPENTVKYGVYCWCFTFFSVSSLALVENTGFYSGFEYTTENIKNK